MDASIVVGDCISICSFPMAMVRRECAKSDQSKAIARKMAIDVKLAKCIAAGGVYRPLTLPMMMCCGRQQCLLILIDKVSNILQSIVHIDTQGFQSVVVDQKSDHGIPICRHLEGALVFGLPVISSLLFFLVTFFLGSLSYSVYKQWCFFFLLFFFVSFFFPARSFSSVAHLARGGGHDRLFLLDCAFIFCFFSFDLSTLFLFYL